MKKQTSSEFSPFRHDFGRPIGSGKDNRVYELEDGSETVDKRFPRRAGEFIVKISHEQDKGSHLSAEEALDSARYNQAKYNLLKQFLGDFVPTTMFLVGNKKTGSGQVVNKSYTVQERVPQFMLNEIGAEKRNSDELRGQMYQLVRRLQLMHQVMGRARDIVEAQGGSFIVEDSLDLGPLSKFVRQHMDDNAADFNYKQIINGFKASPNLLVDPDTMQLSCVDFGQGRWSDELGLQMGVVHDIATHDPEIASFLNNDTNGTLPPQNHRQPTLFDNH